MKVEPQWIGRLFLSRPPHGDPRRFRVDGPLGFRSDIFRTTYTVQEGFYTDGTSVPRAFWWYAAPFAGLHAPAALLHDCLYYSHVTTREEADVVFHEAMRSLGVRKTKAWLMYQSVRKFGGRAWDYYSGNDVYITVQEA